MRVKNKKVLIPQTVGIASLIFVVAGLGLSYGIKLSDKLLRNLGQA